MSTIIILKNIDDDYYPLYILGNYISAIALNETFARSQLGIIAIYLGVFLLGSLVIEDDRKAMYIFI